MKLSLWALAASLAVLAPLLQDRNQDRKPTTKPPTVGEAVPGIRLNDHTGVAVEIPAGEEDRWTVLAFFPKAATPG